MLCPKSPNGALLCAVSVVDEFRAKTHHRDTENTVAQSSLRTRTFEAKLLRNGTRLPQMAHALISLKNPVHPRLGSAQTCSLRSNQNSALQTLLFHLQREISARP